MAREIKHVFPGGNTSTGFYSFYEYILDKEIAKRIICIKGGPGTGKSTLMKTIGKTFFEKGYDVEFHHCSSDNNSLDGIVIKNLNIALLDGTSPHVVDPVYPGAVDEILNIGECWQEFGFEKDKDKVISTVKTISKKFKRAYRYFGAARNILDDWSAFNEDAKNLNEVIKIKETLKKQILSDLPINTYGCERHLFMTALTPNGIISFKESHSKSYEKVFVLKGGPNTCKSDLLKYIGEEALKRGLFVEFYHDPFIPERIENIIIPMLSIAIFSSNEIHSIKLTNSTEIDMDALLNKDILLKNKDEIDFDKTQFYFLINKGLSSIKEAKILHDSLETYYIKNMDFNKIEHITQDLIKRIEEYSNH